MVKTSYQNQEIIMWEIEAQEIFQKKIKTNLFRVFVKIFTC